MFSSKKQKWIKQHRRRNVLKIFQRKRQSELMKLNLGALLTDYKKCALVSGDYDYLGHSNYLDCQAFVYEQHQKINSMVINLDLQEIKPLLHEFQFPNLLYQVMETIENKTLEMDQEITQLSYKSRNLVLSSISNILARFSEDQDLITLFGKDASRCFINQLMRKFNQVEILKNEQYAMIHGLVNLFRLQSFNEIVYNDLCDLNFQVVIQKFLRRLKDRSLVVSNQDKSSLIVTLLLEFLDYQQQNTQKVINPVLQNVIVNFAVETIRGNIKADLEQHQNVLQDQLIDQLLEILTFVSSKSRMEMKVLKMEQIYKKMSFVEYLNHCTYHYGVEVSLRFFQEQQLRQLLECAKQLEKNNYFEPYLESLTSSLFNMIQNTKDMEKAIMRLWNVLHYTKTTHLIFDRQHSNDHLKILTTLLDLHKLE